MSLAPGTRLGAYEVVSPLGAGGMGEVWRARDGRLGREVAIKVLPSEVVGDPGRLKRFEKEARAASALNHPNIVTIYDIGSTDSVAFIAMERIDGKTLRELLFAAPMPIKRLLQIAAQIAEGLAKAHEAGIVHRDLKPENVMVTKDGLVKILDFGLAKQTERVSGTESSHLPTETGTSPGVVLGTVGYMSPEQAGGHIVDFRSDQFSFGAILYEMATGNRAFQKGTAVDTLSAILHEEPPPLGDIAPELPAPVRWIVGNCLAKDPAERYSSTRDLAREIANIRDHLHPAAVTSGAFAARRKHGFPGALVALAAAALLTMLAVGVGVGRRTAKTSPPSFKRLTFQRGNVVTARFTADGQTIVYGASWNGDPFRIFSTRREGPESVALPLPDALFWSISRSGELAMILGSGGTLARAPLSGGAPREVLENVHSADWAPDSSNLLVVRDVAGKSRLEYPIGRVLYESTGGIRYPRVSPRGDMAAFLDNPVPEDDLGSVAVVDREGRKKTLASGFTSSGGLVWSRDGEEVWFTAAKVANEPSLIAVSLSGKQRVLLRTPAPICVLDVGADGSVLIEEHIPSKQIAALPPGETRERDLSWLDYSHACDLSADGKRLLFEESGAGAGDRYRLFLRPTDGSSPKRLFDGGCGALSRDGRWALSLVDIPYPPKIFLVPTGSGESKPIPLEGLTPRNAWFFPDGNRILVAGEEPGHRLRLYVKNLEGGTPRPVTPEGIRVTAYRPISPDGGQIIASDPEGRIQLFPVPEGNAKVLPGAAAGDRPIQWTSDGRGVYVMQRKGVLHSVSRIDVETGRRTLWKEIAPSDPAGFGGIRSLLIAGDETSYVYSHTRTLAELYLVTGLK
ncbi:MAG TPA: protein kinase [Thermoanaerobaculia bacterium]|nr:protein kinase [Thermoanaerobaculia bacterium]